MNDAQLALASVKGISSIIMAGRGLRADLAKALTSASVTLTMEGASTLALNFKDPRRVVLNSGVLGNGMILRLDGYPFQLVQCAKTGTEIATTLEHEAVARLRTHTKPLTVKAGSMTHVQFAKRLVSEERWLRFVTGGKAARANNALTRGQPGQVESSWDALARNGSDRGWRCFVRGVSEVWYVPDSYLVSRPVFQVLEPQKRGVQDIDFDYDIGQPIAEATVTVDTGRWTVPIGEHVALAGVGPANGTGWLVASIARDLFKTTTTVTVHRPNPTLPEPKKDTSGSGSKGKASKSEPASQGDGLGTSATKWVNVAVGERGKPYVWGADGPTSFDCSGLVEWSLKQIGIDFPRTSGAQYEACRKAGTLISVARAEHVKGALLFEGASGSKHVAISLGDGRTIEARGKAYGTNEFSAAGRPWSAAALVPGLVY